MAKFQKAFYNIDDLYLIYLENPWLFLALEQTHSDKNPFWIYFVSIQEIKEETLGFSLNDPQQRVSTYFMNAKLLIHETKLVNFQLRKFDKRRLLTFKYMQYIKFKSNRLIQQAYNILILQVLPILYLSNIDIATLHEIQLVIQTIISNGFQQDKLVKKIQRFLQNKSFLATKVDIKNICASLYVFISYK